MKTPLNQLLSSATPEATGYWVEQIKSMISTERQHIEQAYKDALLEYAPHTKQDAQELASDYFRIKYAQNVNAIKTSKPELSNPLKMLSIADLSALIKGLSDAYNSCKNEEGKEIIENLKSIHSELSNRYSQIFPNNKHFTP